MAQSKEQVWREHPPTGVINPPPYPKRPDLFDEVEWGPYPSYEDTKTAYRLWSLPDSVIAEGLKGIAHPFPRPSPPDEDRLRDTLDVLAFNVYEDLMRNHRMPVADEDWDQDAQMKLAKDGQDKEGWSYDDILGPQKEKDAREEHLSGGNGTDIKIEIDGHDVLKARYWTVARLREALQSRGLNTKGKVAELRRRLYDDEKRTSQDQTEIKAAFLSRTDLSSWGIPRHEDYMLKITENGRLRPLDMYTWAILLSPYNPTYWVSRAYLFYQMGYLDLAVGDAYRAQVLCEILCDPHSRNRQPGLYPRVWHSIEQHVLHIPPPADGSRAPAVDKMREANGVNYFVPTLRKALHNIISLSLSALQCWNDYIEMENYLPERVAMPYRDSSAFEMRLKVAERYVKGFLDERQRQPGLFHYERSAGNVSGRPYPYSARDVDRTSPPFLQRLNKDLIADNQMPWKRCEIRPKEGTRRELGVYATQDIGKGGIIYIDEPSMRGHLNVTRARDACQGQPTWPERCENCKLGITKPPSDLLEGLRKDILGGHHSDFCACVFHKDSGEPLVFCPATQSDGESVNKSCLEVARELHHFRVCGKNWTWLHDAMRPNWNTHRAGDEKFPRYQTHTNESHGTVLSLLLREVFDVTLLRRARTGDPYLLAHEIDELLPLEGEEQWGGDRFPFTLAANIKVPFDILLQLGVNIFRDLTFDTWVVQMVLRKLLLSVVPWDPDRRQNGEPDREEIGREPAAPTVQMREIELGMDVGKSDPSFSNLYLFPGLALFNHSCRHRNNAEWAFDSVVPNRVVVWADQHISKDEEITIGYQYQKLTRHDALRLLGRTCACQSCLHEGPRKARTMSAQDMQRLQAKSKKRKEAGSGDGDDSAAASQSEKRRKQD